ncbi:hypothetical protein F4804DRAFT_352737 [Jackrogersella minutella]|nr:hypothetical protein F4804DRAFT_352737 [Jackrogersella minutella]
MIHIIIDDQLLTPTAKTIYCRFLRQMPFPPGWGQLQAPHHLLKYTLQEHARWSVVIVVLTRLWLKDSMIKQAMVRSIKEAFDEEIKAGIFGVNPTASSIVVGVLAANVRSNMMLTADQMLDHDQDPKNFKAELKRCRTMFQKFAEAAALATGSRGQRPSGLHYPDTLDEYGLVSLLIVLVGEQKHKEPEKTLLAFENFVQTLRLVLTDGFATDNPELTEQMRHIKKSCPTLFASLLSQGESHISTEDADDDDPSIGMNLIATELHKKLSVLVRLSPKHCRSVLHLPLQTGQFSKEWLLKLRRAYKDDYGKNVIVIGNMPCKWWKKLAFTDSTASGHRIILHRAYSESRVFLVIRNVVPSTRPRDPQVDLSILKYEPNVDIIGLPAATVNRFYLVPFTESASGDWLLQTGDGSNHSVEDTLLLFVAWRIQFL